MGISVLRAEKELTYELTVVSDLNSTFKLILYSFCNKSTTSVANISFVSVDNESKMALSMASTKKLQLLFYSLNKQKTTQQLTLQFCSLVCNSIQK